MRFNRAHTTRPVRAVRPGRRTPRRVLIACLLALVALAGQAALILHDVQASHDIAQDGGAEIGSPCSICEWAASRPGATVAVLGASGDLSLAGPERPRPHSRSVVPVRIAGEASAPRAPPFTA